MTDHYDKLEIRDPAERERDLLAALRQAMRKWPWAKELRHRIAPGHGWL